MGKFLRKMFALNSRACSTRPNASVSEDLEQRGLTCPPRNPSAQVSSVTSCVRQEGKLHCSIYLWLHPEAEHLGDSTRLLVAPQRSTMASQVDAVEREFLLCARYGELEEMLEELAKGADVMARGDGGNTALHMACANGHEEIVAALDPDER